MDKRWGGSHLAAKLFFPTVPKNIVGGRHFWICVSEIFWYRNLFRIIGVSRLCRNLLNHNSKNFCWRTLRCLRKVGVSKIFTHKKRISPFSAEFSFVAECGKNSSGDFCVSETICCRNCFWLTWVSRFCWIFLSHSNKKFRKWGPLCFRNVLVSKTFRIIGVSRLCRNLLSDSSKKFLWGSFRCLRKVGLSKNFLHKKGMSLFSVEFFFIAQCGKKSLGNTCMSEKIWCRNNFE